MKKTLIIIGIIILAAVITAAFFLFSGPYVTKYLSLKNPRIITLPNQKVLFVEAKGDPNITGMKAFALLFKTYFSLKETPKGPSMPAPRARWVLTFEMPKKNMIGYIAMPVPESVSSIPEMTNDEGMKVVLTNWEYGETAEILHIGPYDKETPTIEKLMKFIKDSGYETAGLHEEEYIKGPGMLFSSPKDYYTIIRYRVKKRG